MKKILNLILVAAFLVLSIDAPAQAPPPPPSNPSTTGNNVPVGGNAPIGSGLLVLLALGAAYGARKFSNEPNKGEAEIND